MFINRFVFIVFSFFIFSASANEGSRYQAVTAQNIDVDINELEYALTPLTKSEVEVELKAWLVLLKEKATIVSEAEILVSQKQKNIATVGEITSVSESSAELLKQTDKDKAAKEELKRELLELKALSHELNSKKAEQVVEELSDSAENLTSLAEKAGDYNEKLKKRRILLIKNLSTLKEERKAVLNRFKVVLTNWEVKGGDANELRLYATALDGSTVDLSDSSTAWLTIKEWFRSKEGGLLWLANIIKFFVSLTIVYLLSLLAGKITDAMLSRSKTASQLLKQFIQLSIRRVIISIGFLVSLSLLEINVGPVLALIGAAGLVIGLALQSTLSNFASGMLILIYRPFDIGDVIEIDGVTGFVNSMTLLSTAIKTYDNQHLIVPNNSVWGNTIINITGSKTRRVDLVFGIGYSDDMDKAQSIMEEVLSKHELILPTPKPMIKVHELGSSSVNFICRPWVKTQDYWEVYWDITRQVKEQFDLKGITIPFPQRDVHIHQIGKD